MSYPLGPYQSINEFLMNLPDFCYQTKGEILRSAELLNENVHQPTVEVTITKLTKEGILEWRWARRQNHMNAPAEYKRKSNPTPTQSQK